MESSFTFLERISGVLIFCMAISILIMENSILHNTISTLNRSISSQEVLYKHHLEEIDHGVVPYAEVIGILMSELSCDIIVNHIEIKKDIHSPQTFDFTRIDEGRYSKRYELNTKGIIVKIIYSTIE